MDDKYTLTNTYIVTNRPAPTYIIDVTAILQEQARFFTVTSIIQIKKNIEIPVESDLRRFP